MEPHRAPFCRLAPALAPARAGSNVSENPLRAMLDQQFAAAADDPMLRADDARLHEVLRLRKENFEAHAGPDARDARQLVPGRSWAASS